MKSINNIVDYHENRLEITREWRKEKQSQVREKIVSEFSKFDKDLIDKIKEIYIIQIEEVYFEDRLEINVFPEFKDLTRIKDTEKKINEQYKLTKEFNREYLNSVMFDMFETNGSEWISYDTTRAYTTFQFAVNQPLTLCLITFHDEFFMDLSNSALLFKFLKTWRKDWEETSYDEVGRKAIIKAYPWIDKIINDIHIISTLPYEGIDNQGYMLIGDKEPTIKLKEKVPLSQHKRIRKLLQITNKKTILLVEPESKNAYGFILGDSTLTQISNGYLISFQGSFSWRCMFGKDNLFLFEKMIARHPYSNDHNIEEFKRIATDVFQEIETNENVVNLVKEATKQKHGTMLVIMDKDKVEDEGSRLKASSTLIEPIPINEDILSRITEIDGAVLINPSGICYSIGVILDGQIVEGDPGRGARYNSALRYRKSLEESDIKAVIVIISEDGFVDTITTSF